MPRRGRASSARRPGAGAASDSAAATGRGSPPVFQVQDGERLHGVIWPVPFGRELLADVADGQRVNGELAAYHDYREDAGRRGGKRGRGRLGLAQQVRRGLGPCGSRSFRVLAEGAGVGEFTGRDLHRAGDDLGEDDVAAEVDPVVAVLAGTERGPQAFFVKNARPPPISRGASCRSSSSARVSIISLHTWIQARRGFSP